MEIIILYHADETVENEDDLQLLLFYQFNTFMSREKTKAIYYKLSITLKMQNSFWTIILKKNSSSWTKILLAVQVYKIKDTTKQLKLIEIQIVYEKYSRKLNIFRV